MNIYGKTAVFVSLAFFASGCGIGGDESPPEETISTEIAAEPTTAEQSYESVHVQPELTNNPFVQSVELDAYSARTEIVCAEGVMSTEPPINKEAEEGVESSSNGNIITTFFDLESKDVYVRFSKEIFPAAIIVNNEMAGVVRLPSSSSPQSTQLLLKSDAYGNINSIVLCGYPSQQTPEDTSEQTAIPTDDQSETTAEPSSTVSPTTDDGE